MITSTELRIFKDLSGDSTVSKLAEEIGVDVSTVSKYVSMSIERENGLFEKRKEGKSVFIKRANTSHSNLLKTIFNEYPRWEVEKLFSHSRLKVAAVISEPKYVKDIVFITGLSRQYVRECLKRLSSVGIVIKEDSMYRLNPDMRIVVNFIDNYFSFNNEKKAKELCSDSVVLWQRGEEFLFKTSEELEKIEKTGVSRFYEFDVPIVVDKNYYFKTERVLDIHDIIVHTVLIDEKSVTYNTYACLLYLKENLEDILTRARIYDIEEHFHKIVEFLEKRERVERNLPECEEFVEIAEEYEVSL
ncbi:MAG: hypothetical protein R6W73_09340 [Candidatus Saliniplasma sp.]